MRDCSPSLIFTTWAGGFGAPFLPAQSKEYEELCMDPIIGNIITACITGVLALIGVVFSNTMSNKAIENKLTTAQAVTDEKIDNLTKSIDRHTSSIDKIPVLEHRVDELDKKQEKLESRINTLDRRKA